MTITALIMAGGQGMRFWPLSRKERPKQFLKLASPIDSLLQQTFKRIEKLVSPAQIFIVTNSDYRELILDQIKKIPSENIIVEPLQKNTAPAIGLSTLYIEKKYPDSVMVVLPADHVISGEKVFINTLQKAVLIAEKRDTLVTLGITPTHPETEYGYICCNKTPERHLRSKIYEATAFVEKPDLEKARQYLSAGNYLWNSGIFIWQISSIIKNIELNLPELFLALEKIKEALGTETEDKVITREYKKLNPVSIDRGVLEKAKKITVIPADFGWDDLGNWLALQRINKVDPRGNLIKGKHFGIETKDTIIYSPEKMVMSIGIENLLIVNTGDSIFLCDKNRLKDIKTLLSLLKDTEFEEYL